MGLMTSCGDDDDEKATSSYDYAFSGAYVGDHPTDLTGKMTLTEMDNGNTMITVELNNTIDGETYPMHAHDKDADSATGYVETPNGAIFAQGLMGNGGTASVSQEASMSYTELTTNYSGFFVTHDPLQAVSTSDATTFLLVADFAR